MKHISVNIFILILTLAALTACSPATAANTSAGNDNGQAALVTKMSDGEELNPQRQLQANPMTVLAFRSRSYQITAFL